MYSLLKTLLLPPASLIILILIGLFMGQNSKFGRSLAWVSALVLLLLSLPVVASYLLDGLEPYPPVDLQDPAARAAQAVVVLSAGSKRNAPEYGAESIGPRTLQRVRYGVRLHRLTGLPLYFSGGKPGANRPPLARGMQRVAEEEYGVSVAGVEEKSRTTRQNARYTAALLRSRGIKRILLVSHAWHLPRAVEAFRQTGLDVIPAPTDYFGFRKDGKYSSLAAVMFLPSSKALHKSYFAIHEYLGRAWYKVTQGGNS